MRTTGWVANVCGTSERMIFEHYRKWMNNLIRRDGGRVASLYGGSIPKFGHRMGTEAPGGMKINSDFRDNLVEAGELNRPRNSDSLAGKVLDSPAKSGTFTDFPDDRGRPKTAQKSLYNPEKPDRVRSGKCGTKRPKNS